MATMAQLEQRVVLQNVSWETYERLLAERTESPGTRFTYDEGALEITVVSIAHENPNRTLAQLVDILAEETEEISTTPVQPRSSERTWPKDSSLIPASTSATPSRLAAGRNWIRRRILRLTW